MSGIKIVQFGSLEAILVQLNYEGTVQFWDSISFFFKEISGVERCSSTSPSLLGHDDVLCYRSPLLCKGKFPTHDSLNY